MAWKTKGTDPKDAQIEELKREVNACHKEIRGLSKALEAAQKGVPQEPQEVDVVLAALALEEPLREEARRLEDRPNVDAMKAALMNAAHGIAHVRKVNASRHTPTDDRRL